MVSLFSWSELVRKASLRGVVIACWIGGRADPDRHVTVTVIDVIGVNLIEDDRVGELEQDVIMVTANIIHYVGIVSHSSRPHLLHPSPENKRRGNRCSMFRRCPYG